MDTIKNEEESLHFLEYISDDLDFSNTCRVCMAQCIEPSLYSLSTTSQSTGQLIDCIEKIHYCTNVKITKNDGLPYTICQACVNLLDKAYEFRIICENSDQELRKIIKKTSIANQNYNIKDEENIDATYNHTVSLDVNKSEENMDDMFEYECLDDTNYIQPDLQLVVSEINECNELNMGAINAEIANRVNIPEKIYVNMKSKLSNCSKATKLQTRSVGENIDGNTFNDGVSRIIDKTTKEISEPEIEIEILRIERKVGKIRRLKCRCCTEIFPDKKSRDEHQKSHGLRSYICDICGKGFFCKTTCYTHRKSHFPPKFSCDQCPYKTCHRNDLTKHNRIHSGVKLYQCEYCSRSFTFNSNLVKHIKRHRDDRQYQCHLCTKAYYDKVSLSEHLDWHKGIKRHECRICGMAYVDRQHWVRHMEKMHQVQVPPTKSGRRKTSIQVTEPIHSSTEVETHSIQASA